MPLNDFFSINLPYGIVRNEQNNWTAFNREYQPLGIPKSENLSETDYQSLMDEHSAKYRGLTEKNILSLVKKQGKVQRDEKGSIFRVFFYDDVTNPKLNSIYWGAYLDIIKRLSLYQVSK